MTDSSFVWQRNPITYWLTPLVAVAHFAAAVLLVGVIGRVEDGIWLLATTALPVSQATLLAIWAAVSRVASFVRIPLAIVGLAGVWYVDCQSLAWTCEDFRSAAHAGMFAVQATVVFAVPAGVGCYARRSLRHEGEEALARKRFQFTLGALLAWAVAIGVLLGLGRAALAASGWTRDVVGGQLFRHGLVIGAYNACYGLLIAWAVLLGRRRLWRWAIASLAVGLLAWSEGPALLAVFGSNGRVSVTHWIAWSAFQVLYLSATLIPVSLALRLACRSSIASKSGA